MVRAKFVCQSVKQSKQYDGKMVNEFEFMAIYGGGKENDENKAFWEATPSGNIKLSCVKPEVTFQIGEEYYVDFSGVV